MMCVSANHLPPFCTRPCVVRVERRILRMCVDYCMLWMSRAVHLYTYISIQSPKLCFQHTIFMTCNDKWWMRRTRPLQSKYPKNKLEKYERAEKKEKRRKYCVIPKSNSRPRRASTILIRHIDKKINIYFWS